MKKYILISEKECVGEDEWYCNWYECKQCGKASITPDFKFCPMCGIALRFKKETK